MTGLPIQFRTDDTRGVSDLVGYSILFGIFLTSVVTVTVIGFDELTAVADDRGWDQTRSQLVEYQQMLTQIGTGSESAGYISIPVTADRVTLQPTQLNVTLTNATGASETISLSQRVLSATDDTDTVDRTVGVEAGFLLDSVSIRGYEQPTYQCGEDVITLFAINSDVSNTSVQQRGFGDPARTTDLTTATDAQTVQLYIQRTRTAVYTNITTAQIQLGNSVFDTAWDELATVSEWQRTGDTLRCNRTPMNVKIVTIGISFE